MRRPPRSSCRPGSTPTAPRADPGRGYPAPPMASSMDEPRPSYLSELDPEHDRHRRRVALVVVLVLLSVIVAGVAFANSSYNRCKQPPAADGRTVTFEVPDGATGHDVVAALAERGLIRCGGFVGDLLLRGDGNGNSILAGTYRIPVGSSLHQIITIVSTPPKEVPTDKLTVPEGLRIRSTYPGERSMASVVHNATGISPAAFAKAAEDPSITLPPYLPAGTGA